METNEKNKTKLIVNLYYPALMLFLVYTFADGLLRGIIQNYTIELLLYLFMWIFLTVQTTFAYIRIKNVDPKDYSTMALLSDCLDILIAVYVCAAMGGMYGINENNELSSYLHLSVPFLILSVNQFSWFVMVKKFDIPAIFRISILFFGMLAISVSELICHSFWNLFAVSFLIVLLGILRAINKAPGKFGDIVTRIWYEVKRRWFPHLI